MNILKIGAGVVIGAVVGGLAGYAGKCRSGSCPLTGSPFMGAIYGATFGGLLAAVFLGP